MAARSVARPEGESGGFWQFARALLFEPLRGYGAWCPSSFFLCSPCTSRVNAPG